jgi:TolB-like protein
MLLPVLVVGFMLFTLAVLAIIFAPAILKQARVRQPPPPVPAVPTTPSALSIPEKSIAVLPFENLSRDPDNAFFTDGVQDEILTHLARIADLKVISRTSVMQFKTGVQRNLREIGQQLGVAHVLEGSVQRANNRIRVNAQLIDARNDAHLWAQTYDRDLADVFAIQSEIAKAIADQLQARILPQEQHEIDKQPTKDLAAYDLYVRARAEMNVAPNSDQPREHFFTAVNLLKQALARDPRFVGAYCRLAEVHDRLYLFGADHTPQRLALAEEALNAALGLQPDSPEAPAQVTSTPSSITTAREPRWKMFIAPYQITPEPMS